MASTRRKAGLLGPQVEGYGTWLAVRGYTPSSVRKLLTVLGQVGIWLRDEGLEVTQLDDEGLAAFHEARRADGHRRVPGARAMAPLLAYLREIGVAPVPEDQPVLTPLGVLLGSYRSWMVQERGLAPGTVLRYERTAGRFLREQASTGEAFQPARLTGVDVSEFLLREFARVSAGSAKGRVAELRSVLRFLYLEGITAMALGTAVPPVGGWRLAKLPPAAMAAVEVQRLLDSCDTGTPVGVRDLAMMTLVARLGLRSVEVARLELRDLDWRAGELVVRGKGHREDRLPLLAEVGEALVAYLSIQRSPAGSRHVFLTGKAPRGPIRPYLVCGVVKRACRRACLPEVGPHRLRHALAGGLLRQGAGLVAISQVLRHQDLGTTALYAKVDLDGLRQVAQPWPGTTR